MSNSVVVVVVVVDNVRLLRIIICELVENASVGVTTASLNIKIMLAIATTAHDDINTDILRSGDDLIIFCC